MAKQVQTIVNLIDDIDGSKADRTVSYTWQHVNYEIDLSKSNAAAFEKAMKPYVSASRKVAGSKAKTKAKTPAYNRADLMAWAAKNGHKVSERGRVAESIVEAFLSAS